VKYPSDTPLDHVPMTQRLRTCLRRGKLVTAGDVRALGVHGVFLLPELGSKSLKEAKGLFFDEPVSAGIDYEKLAAAILRQLAAR
jgi:DNA-directed RNA polymerase alpha subunit